jgi:MYXO-CTERM domain-containing protein
MRHLVITLVAVMLFSGRATADWPPAVGSDLTNPANQPNDPGYSGDWNYWSYIPAADADHVSAYQNMIGAGIHADEAWEHTTGNRRVVIAVIDSGIRWGEPDLVNKFYLNRGELPVPDPACGTGSASDPWDANGDGVFNVQDYTTARGAQQPTPDTVCDPRVSDKNGNGLIDPQDLIMIFSDGVDTDGNGYIDDIAGWDAYYDDNDPSDDTDYGHGTGEAKDSSAQGNNAIDDIGVCPDCTVMMVRAGDSFICEGNDFAAGVFYAIDQGAAIIQNAQGCTDTAPLARTAIDYADAQGVPVVTSAADEDSFHHNVPGTYNHTIYVHANMYGPQDNIDTAETFLAYNNCTNYGAQLLLSTPGTACSSEAVGKTSGAVGLIVSAALQAGITPLDTASPTDTFGVRRLDAEEVKQLLVQSVDSVYDPATENDPNLYPTVPGWNQRFGYGRTNVARAVQMVLAGQIPPIVDVTGPGWFDTVYPEQTPSVTIQGTIRYRHALYSSYDYVVEWAPGVQPDDSTWTSITSGQTQTADMIETGLATWDISQLTVNNPSMPEPDLDVNRNMVTVRVRVTMHGAGSAEGVTGEIRRAFHVVHDPTLVAGFPIKLPGGGESSPKIVDLFGDGKMEIVQADASGTIHVLDASGNEQTGWPQHTAALARTQTHATSHSIASGGWPADARASIIATPAIGALAGDGKKDIVVADLEGDVYAWDTSGNAVPGFPVQLDATAGKMSTPNNFVAVGALASPVLGDLDGDGTLEVIVAGLDGQLYAWHHDGTPVAGFPVALSNGEQRSRIIGTPALGDIDGDGKPEIVVGTTENYQDVGDLYAVAHDGTMVPGWPVQLPTIDVLPDIGVGLPSSPAMADIDGDGKVEVAMPGVATQPNMYGSDGTVIATFDDGTYGSSSTVTDNPSAPVIADGAWGNLDNGPSLHYVLPGVGYSYLSALTGPGGMKASFQHLVSAWTVPKKAPASGTYAYADGFPVRADDHQFFMNPAIADVDGDGLPEVIAGSGGYYLRAWNIHGVQPVGWPKMTGQWIIASPAVGDLDGDGKLEVAVSTREGFLYAWHTTGATNGRVDWASFHHDDANTGNFSTKLAFGSPASSSNGGCGCSSARADLPGGVLLVLVIAGTAGSRRRRRTSSWWRWRCSRFPPSGP